MKTHPFFQILLALLLFSSVLISPIRLTAQGTAFTYQGHLTDNGSPANGVYDLTFQTFDALTAGSSIGGTVTVNAVGVTNGLFTAMVDLGSAPFTGPARWLQIGVSTNGAGSFTTLAPRQALTPSPYAIFANTAGTVTNGAIANAQLAADAVSAANIKNSTITADRIASGQMVKSLNGLTDGVSLTQGANVTIDTVGNSLQISAPAGGLNLPFSGSASSTGSVFTIANSGTGSAGTFMGWVGIGTSTPQANLHIQTDGEGIRVQGPAAGNLNQSWLSFVDSANVRIGYVGDGSIFDKDVLLTSDSGGVVLNTPAGRVLTATSGGNVGIGTSTPAAKLDVRGDIRLGSSGQYRATSGEENLRIIRGGVASDGSILAGMGFTVAHLSLGRYHVIFNTAFASLPTVTATADRDPLASAPPWTALTDNTTDSDTEILTYFLSPGNEGYYDRAFQFIAVGPR